MLLSDEEISDLWVTELDDRETVSAFARAIEAAILAKLASAELPELRDLNKEECEFIHYNPNTSDLVDFIQGHTIMYGRDAYNAGYAQGAAAQLSSEPVGFIDKCGEIFAQVEQILSTDTPLYTRREA